MLDQRCSPTLANATNAGQELDATESGDYPMSTRSLERTEVWIAHLDGSTSLVLATDRVLLEAPNWAPDGRSLLLNGGGTVWRLDLDGSRDLSVVAVDGLPPINNDHVVEPAGQRIYLSANDGQIYRAH